MYAEAVWKQIEKKQLNVADLVGRDKVAQLADGLTEEALGRRLFELAAAAQARGLDPEAALRHETSRIVQEIESAALRDQPAAG
jgi:XTP/dITP diphosphohydrolase/tetrapyrrole methylase family protein/MazG family protein